MVLDSLEANLSIVGGEARRWIAGEFFGVRIIAEEAPIIVGSLEGDDPLGIAGQRGCVGRVGGEESFRVRFARIRLFHGEEQAVPRLGTMTA